jgi:GMP synthase-like glutamine amidotransferase
MVVFLQNVASEGPGTIASYLLAWDVAFRTVRLFEGQVSPSLLAGATHLVVLGGSMNVYQEREYPFLKTECHLIEKAIRADLPTLGICLGAQLVAKVVGATISKASVKEVGWYAVQLTLEGQQDPLFKGLGNELRVFQWHEDTFDLPRGAVLLARSPGCRNQAFRYNGSIYGVQFHLEVDREMIDNWFEEYDPENAVRRHALFEYDKASTAFHEQATRLYDNFFQRRVEGDAG